MRSFASAAGVILALGTTAAAAGTSVLFIGNSFLFGSGSAVRFYRADTVTDLNHEGIGGVPALFKSFTQQAGLDYDVALETRGGMGLDFHLVSKSDVIGAHHRGSVGHRDRHVDAAVPRGRREVFRLDPELDAGAQFGAADLIAVRIEHGPTAVGSVLEKPHHHRRCAIDDDRSGRGQRRAG